MQLVTAVIQPHRLEVVKEALKEAAVSGMTLTEVRGFGRQGSHTETYRGAEYEVDFIPKLKLEVLCTEGDVDRIIELIVGAARTDQIGDGKVWVTPLSSVVRIRTGEAGQDAI
ncbi:MAG: P-II family nitrogen regulator [Acidimicrobiia bacterium]|nr:P-II family nitrogen regulator [Acidimicrobiia bacterium]